MEKVGLEKQLKKRPQKPRHETFTDWARDAAQVITVPIARFLARLGIHPNSVTVLGSLLSIGIGAILLNGNLALGGWLLAIVAPLDAVDGALARFVGQKSDFGAFLDSTLDRVSEAALLIGLAGHFLQQGATTAVILAIVTLFSSVMVSYTRARAESTGFSCKVGVFSRLERTVVLAAGLILGYATVALWVLAIGATFTALHRILHVYHQSRQQSAGE